MKTFCAGIDFVRWGSFLGGDVIRSIPSVVSRDDGLVSESFSSSSFSLYESISVTCAECCIGCTVASGRASSNGSFVLSEARTSCLYLYLE